MTTTFDPGKRSLQDMMRAVAEGKVQLPDFQRGWVWTDDHIRSLLASVSLSYPIGAVMMLGTGNPDVRFKLRPLEGATPPANQVPDLLLLDGQQRLTSLFQALSSGKVVETRDSRDKAVKRWYYIDMRKAIDPEADREEAFISVPEDRKVRNFRNEVIYDYSTPALEREAGLFPVTLIVGDYEDWAEEYRDLSTEHKERWKAFRKTVIEPCRNYQVPVITMDKSTPKEAVCQVFEKVNTGGVSLTVFELLTATFAADDYQLREAWYGDSSEKRPGTQQRFAQRPILTSVENTDFLQAVTLLASHARRLAQLQAGKSEQEAPAITCKRKDILKLTLAEYKQHAEAVERGFLKAAQFLRSQKMFTARDLPYRTQLVPLAATLAVLGEKVESVAVQDKLAQWYWCGIFGELYASATETRFAKDFPELLAWIGGGHEPDTVREANFVPQRLDDLRTRNSAAYKGVYALLMRDGAEDFRTGQAATDTAYFDENMDVHHIFPQAWCGEQGVKKNVYDSVINKTPLALKTNRKIGGSAPSTYLDKLQREENIGSERMDEILQTHVIDVHALRADDFQAFFEARRAALLDRIAQAMNKPIAQQQSA
ncbi:GmrSD restriction endonuclease domain-containing protein [Deinococcus sp.]|uniref:GmrSD restriction endonuclease domain-containing protein n=1 Tax=Deinococcus sp. TaxID=47478 RepID=UPI003B5CD0BE